jgi:hypothetical protein
VSSLHSFKVGLRKRKLVRFWVVSRGQIGGWWLQGRMGRDKGVVAGDRASENVRSKRNRRELALLHLPPKQVNTYLELLNL